MITICANGGHRNIVTILDHGVLPSSDYYFIDMEFCELNLGDYIDGKYPTFDEGDTQPSRNLEFVPKDSSLNLRMQNIWTIMSEITDGLMFIHDHQFVHRDLKPRNGGHIYIIDVDDSFIF